ncbi:MAG: hypothetical protein ABS59_10300 [Methylobacterium sp. SCN 67-24]|nr:MAG: hypothetical protein ABS59_10300 [Methylobacterium sp. SCN 67-24]
MHKIDELPIAFRKLREIGSVVEFGVFGDFIAPREDVGFAVRATLPQTSSFKSTKLSEIDSRSIPRSEFFGDWFDSKAGALIKVGRWRTADGEELQNPLLKNLDDIKLDSGSCTLPDPGSGGQFAFALTRPPYPLRARPSEVQKLFEEVCLFLFPPLQKAEITDWSSPKLPEVSDYFADGMEWWGVFLFTIYLPDLKRLTVIAASATD